MTHTTDSIYPQGHAHTPREPGGLPLIPGSLATDVDGHKALGFNRL